MSQKPPKCPDLNSRGAEGADREESEMNPRPRSALDRLQRQVEEELRQSDRLLDTIDGLIAESKGGILGNYCRPRSAQNENCLNLKPSINSGLRTPYSSHASKCNEEKEEPDLSCCSSSAKESRSRDRINLLCGSNKGPRLPSPECPKTRTRPHLKQGNQDSLNTDCYLNMIRDSSGMCNRDVSPTTRNASRMAQHNLPSADCKSPLNKNVKSNCNRHMNESSEPQAESSRCSGRGKRTGSPTFTSSHVTDIMRDEDMYLQSTIYPENQYPQCKKGMTSHGRTGMTCHDTTGMTSRNTMGMTCHDTTGMTSHNTTGMTSHNTTGMTCHDTTGMTCHDTTSTRNEKSPPDCSGRDDRAKAALSHLSQLKKTPSYFRCGLQQGTEFLDVCRPKMKDLLKEGGKTVKFPKTPCLKSEDIDRLIKCETSDVESVWYLTSDEKKVSKKPCPKQQKAQMIVKNIVQTYPAQSGGIQMYPPLEHPDPEDISPEVAAAMMFSQEQGIEIDECPDAFIVHLFPDERKSVAKEKLREGSVAVVDPDQDDQEKMIEKSASVPSEGVSDSAYTRTMKEKGEDAKPKPFELDFTSCLSKSEYLLVAQKPQRVSKVQFRGNLPTWFPGYYSAFPDDDGLKMVSSPSELLQKAWLYASPENIPASDITVLE